MISDLERIRTAVAVLVEYARANAREDQFNDISHNAGIALVGINRIIDQLKEDVAMRTLRVVRDHDIRTGGAPLSASLRAIIGEVTK